MMFFWRLSSAAQEHIMAIPRAVAIKLSEADRAVSIGWSRRRKTA
jgi:hypothetical protein